ncbi:MAG: Vitamin B12 dependent methionine synthase activation subunit [Clostridia bacterium]|nr:Vitamin B12 dependent methionine synthase activation subunit [Clostridia bacterium]
MNSVILSKNYIEPPFCEREILRYAGCKSVDAELSALLKLCIKEANGKFDYKVCYREFHISLDGDVCDFGAFRLKSEKLAANLSHCKRVIIFAATVGVEIDRLIAKYGRLSPSKALMFQAIGAERIEALCDTFCDDISSEMNVALKPRFSPGYGDLPLDSQNAIFSVLDCGKRIGLSLNDSLLMSPSKSVTAFAGISDIEEKHTTNKCGACNQKDCAFRGAL